MKLITTLTKGFHRPVSCMYLICVPCCIKWDNDLGQYNLEKNVQLDPSGLAVHYFLVCTVLVRYPLLKS